MSKVFGLWHESMDFEEELEELVKDYLTWNSTVSVEERRANAIKVLEEQILLLKNETREL